MKKLVIVRHGKSSWNNPHISDYDRPLNDKGLHDAPAMAEYLKTKNMKFDFLVSSPAVRAKATAEIFAKVLEIEPQSIVFDKGLYLATTQKLFDIIMSFDNKLKCGVIFGHNPGLTDFVNSVIYRAYIDEISTSGVVLLELDSKNWVDIFIKPSKLVEYINPKKLKGNSK